MDARRHEGKNTRTRAHNSGEVQGYTFDTSFCKRLCHSEDRLIMELDDLDGMEWSESPLVTADKHA